MASSGSGESNFIFDFVLGGVSAGVSKTLVAPIERVKLLLQLQDAKKGMEDASKKYKGIVDCFLRVNQEQGFASFWRGNFSNVLRYFPAQAFNFAFKDTIKKIFPFYSSKNDLIKSFIVNMVSGGIAGSISLTLLYPLDFIRTRLATDIGKSEIDREFAGMKDLIVKIIKSDGIPGIYRGLGVSIACAFFYRALYFGLFDTGKERIFSNMNDTGFFTMFLFAQFVTTVSGLATYPLDTVRRRMMMQSGRDDVLYKNTFDCFRKIYWNEGGILPFFKGGWTNVIRSTGGALVLVFYNKIQAYFGYHSKFSD